MNRLPQKKKRGDPILAEDWNTLLDAIAARTPRPGNGLELIASSGGFAYSQPSNLIIPRQSLPPFAVIGIEKPAEDEGDTYQVIIKEGWVIERKPKTGDKPKVKFHMPESLEAEKLNATPRPKTPMAFNDLLWCKIKTNVKGEITEAPQIVVAPEGEDGEIVLEGSDEAHYQPEDPSESGIEGEYYVKLFKLEDDGGTPQVKVYQQSDIEHWAQLWTGENIGGGAGIYKRHNEAANIFQFRRVRGDYGINETEAANEVELDFLAENVGEGCPVWVEPVDDQGQPEADPPDGPAKFRSIAGRLSQPQIQVECEAANPGDPLPETIRVVGNSVDGAILLEEDEESTDLVRWQDGLVTTPGEKTLKVEEFKVCVDGYPETRKFVVVP